MQLKQALIHGIELLEQAGVASPAITAEVLLMHAARCDRAHLHGHPEQELTEAERAEYDRYLSERLQGKPAQYITGHQEFWGMDFLVNPAVLIPRPETELVVEAAVDVAQRCFPRNAILHIADVGTGSGCIAVALARELPCARIYALDRSPAALDTARQNAERLSASGRITFFISDLLRCTGGVLPPLQMVVSNPPYVAERDRCSVGREVRDFEPEEALFAGESGQEVYHRLIPQAAQAMPAGGYLVMELGYDSESGVRGLLQTSGWDEVRWLPDLAGITRVVTARRPARKP